jgi:hypothetical protein
VRYDELVQEMTVMLKIHSLGKEGKGERLVPPTRETGIIVQHSRTPIHLGLSRFPNLLDIYTFNIQLAAQHIRSCTYLTQLN